MDSESTAAVPAEARPRRVVAAFDSYEEAERAVDFLSDREFAVERIAIVGSGLKLVEEVVGRRTTSGAAQAGAMQGATTGLFFALLLGLFFDVEGGFIGLLLYGLIAGAIFGAALAALTHAGQRGRRDFASASTMQAERYELQVDADVADRAGELLRELDPPSSPDPD